MCKDSDEIQCPIWMKMGECSKNPAFMTQQCALSCGKCGNKTFDSCFTFMKLNLIAIKKDLLT